MDYSQKLDPSLRNILENADIPDELKQRINNH